MRVLTAVTVRGAAVASSALVAVRATALSVKQITDNELRRLDGAKVNVRVRVGRSSRQSGEGSKAEDGEGVHLA